MSGIWSYGTKNNRIGQISQKTIVSGQMDANRYEQSNVLNLKFEIFANIRGNPLGVL